MNAMALFKTDSEAGDMAQEGDQLQETGSRLGFFLLGYRKAHPRKRLYYYTRENATDLFCQACDVNLGEYVQLQSTHIDSCPAIERYVIIGRLVASGVPAKIAVQAVSEEEP